jgi:hypothetical protein
MINKCISIAALRHMYGFGKEWILILKNTNEAIDFISMRASPLIFIDLLIVHVATVMLMNSARQLYTVHRGRT